MTEADERDALMALAAARGSSLAALSRLLGRNAAYLQQYVRRASPRRLEERDRRALAMFFGVDEAALGGPAMGAPVIAVPRLDARAAAGAGGLGDDRLLGEMRLDPALVARLGVSPRALSIVRAQGDSMTPGIEDGDELLVDGTDTRLARKAGLFVVRVEDALLVKRVARAGARVTLASDNPAYPTRDLDAAAVSVIGRVVWLSRCPR